MSTKSLPQLTMQSLEFFCELMKNQSHKKTAALLGLSSPKASRLLKELRTEFGDELFFKMGAKMLPTQRAQEIFPAIEKALATFADITRKESFSPKRLSKTFRVAATDNAIPSFFNLAMPIFYEQAPNAGLEIIPIRSTLLHDLKSGFCDFAVFPWRSGFDALNRAPLFRKNYTILLPKNHPLEKLYEKNGVLHQEELLQYKQIKTSFELPSATGRTIDGYALGREVPARSEAAVITPYFLSVPMLLRQSPYYAVVTECSARQFAQMHQDLTFLPMPEGSAARGRLTMLLWDPRIERNPAHVWLRELFLDISRKNKLLE